MAKSNILYQGSYDQNELITADIGQKTNIDLASRHHKLSYQIEIKNSGLCRWQISMRM